MNLNPAIVLDPVFQFLNWIIAEGEFVCFSRSSGCRRVAGRDCVTELARPHAGWACRARFRAFLLRQCR